MYIFKNAFRNIVRSVGRNLLIGIIVLVIATSSCVALSIKQASSTAREEALSGIKITAQISVDRQKIMEQFRNRENQRNALQNIDTLTIDELKTYAEAEAVEDFYYTLTTAMNAAGKLEPFDTTGVEQEDEDDTSSTASTASTTTAKATKAITVKTLGTNGNSTGWVRTVNEITPYEDGDSSTENTVSEPEDAVNSDAEGTASEESTSSEEVSSDATASAPQQDTTSTPATDIPGDMGGRPQFGDWGANPGGDTDGDLQVPPDGFSTDGDNNTNGGFGSFGGNSGGNRGNGNTNDNANGNTGGFGGNMGGGFGGGAMGEIDRSAFMAGRMGMQGDFVIVGYSAESAMTDFTSGIKKITSGAIFDFATEEKVCIISDELAAYNELEVGDKIKLKNPNNEEETFKFEIVGIYNNAEAGATDANQMGGFSTAQDAANQIYTSYPALKKITTTSIANGETETEEDTGRTSSTALREQESGTYVFANVDDYDKFEAQARALGLAEEYTISSQDVSSFDAKVAPLENLGKFATYFLIIVLAIGAIILAVFNIFSIRERKYEIGVLAAIGMKKVKVAIQFLSEIFIVTFISILIGATIGATISVPVTNTLLEGQITSSQSTRMEQNRNFGRGEQMGMPGMQQQTDYITSVTSATNMTVVLQLMGIGILLTLAAGSVAMVSVLRYKPLKILTMRD